MITSKKNDGQNLVRLTVSDCPRHYWIKICGCLDGQPSEQHGLSVLLFSYP